MSGRRAHRKPQLTTTTTVDSPPMLCHSDRRLIALPVAAAVVSGIFHNSGGNPVLAFVSAGVALATLASLVGRSVEALGDRLGSGATGVLQSFLGNLPEFFVIMFSLKAGLFEVVRATIVGSIMAYLECVRLSHPNADCSNEHASRTT